MQKEINIVVFTTEGNTEHKKLKNSISLKEMQKIVGGYIEAVHLCSNEVMIVNEEGKLDNLPYNKIATEYFQSKTKSSDVIVGNAFVIQRKDWE